jgi:hypothetical protein
MGIHVGWRGLICRKSPPASGSDGDLRYADLEFRSMNPEIRSRLEELRVDCVEISITKLSFRDSCRDLGSKECKVRITNRVIRI